MKAYLLEFNQPYYHNGSGKSEGERSRSKMSKPLSSKFKVDSVKSIQECQNNHTFISTHRLKQQNKTEEMVPRQISLRQSKPQHYRKHGDYILDQTSLDRKKQIPIFNKTHSKNRLKTQNFHDHGETVKLDSRQANKYLDLVDEPALGIVKNRLNNDKKGKKEHIYENTAVKQLISLIQMAKDGIYGSKIQSKQFKNNPEQTLIRRETSPQIKQINDMIQIKIEDIHDEVRKEGFKNRQLDLCKSLTEMWTLVKSSNVKQKQGNQIRLISKIRELQQKNVRLMCLVNQLKKGGIDVDSYWSQCSSTS